MKDKIISAITRHKLWLVDPSQITSMFFEIADPVPLESEDRDGISLITIRGPLIRGASDMDRMLGAIDHSDVSRIIEEEAKGGKRIQLYFDSPGGTLTGTPELANTVKRVADEGCIIGSHTDTMRASAAEYISAGATIITASPSAVVGSIGCVLTVVDVSKMLEAAGFQVHNFASGPQKGAGNPMLPLSTEQAISLQQSVDSAASDFFEWMIENRNELSGEGTFDGGTFRGKEALARGLIDEVASDLDGAIAILREL